MDRTSRTPVSGAHRSEPTVFSFTIAGSKWAPREARRTLARRARHALDRIALETLILLTSEAVTNCVEHGGADDGRPIEVAARIDARVARLEVSSAGGETFDLDRSRRSTLAPSGRGLFIVDALAERWGIETDAAMSIWFEVPRWSRRPRTPSLAPMGALARLCDRAQPNLSAERRSYV